MEKISSRSEYDSLLGGDQSLPTVLPVGDFINSRIQEIKALTEVIETPSSAIADMRSFPKHMRRRAMSHNIKRIPKRLRDLHAALREKSNTREGSSKIPRRKYRRRPKELLKEYNRRQKKAVWLETHIWHAKRFKMITKWGYKLPQKPNDKSYRACYRASANHCLLQDISYNNCIELRGMEKTLLLGLSRHTNPETGLTFAANSTISGLREGFVMFYRADKYPFGAIGEVNFIWKPLSLESTESRSIWLWCHPGSHEELLIELIATFGLLEAQDEENMESNIEHVENRVDMRKIELRNVPFVQTPKYCNQEGVTLVVLKDTLNRFRLIGPLSQAVLSRNLKPIHLEKRRKETSDWVQEYYFGEGKDTRSSCEAQLELWATVQHCHSPAQLTPRCVIPLTIIDPRFIMSTSRIKVEDISSCQQPSSFEVPQDPLHLDSPLWSHSIRDRVTKNKLKTEQVNNMRSDKMVPGLEVEWLDTAELHDFPCIPVILIQRSGSQESSKRLGFGSGWDVISPCGYGMPLWLSFVLSGARVGGLREADAFNRESSIHQNYVHSDTAVGKAEENEKRKECTDHFFRLPPAKRRNYIKLNVPTPFHCPWSILANDWGGTEEFYVMRNKNFLNSLCICLNKGANYNFLNVDEFKPGGLIPVRIDIKGKGNLDSCAHICLIQEDDLKFPPRECPKLDDLQIERHNLRTKHKRLLRQLARKRHIARGTEREERLDSVKEEDKEFKQAILENSSEIYIKEYAERMRKLWLPSCSTIKNLCNRTIIGFVSNGDFCFTEGKSSGVGYVALRGFVEYLKSRISNKNIILIRSPNTDQYRLAFINIIC